MFEYQEMMIQVELSAIRDHARKNLETQKQSVKTLTIRKFTFQ